MLILWPATAALGALLGLGVITGALLSHARLGLVVKDDGGLLFALAVIVFLSSATVVYLRRAELPVIGERFFRNVTA